MVHDAVTPRVLARPTPPHRLTLALMPANAEIVSIDAFNDTDSGAPVLAIAYFRKAANPQKGMLGTCWLNIYALPPGTSLASLCEGERRSEQHASSGDKWLDTLSAFFGTANVVQNISLPYTPFCMTHTPIKVGERVTMALLVSGSDRNVHVFAPTSAPTTTARSSPFKSKHKEVLPGGTVLVKRSHHPPLVYHPFPELLHLPSPVVSLR
jgi:hypothetical protein